jgi:tetratricopeptide (TPR) repeat protein
MKKLDNIENEIEKAIMYTNIANLLFFKGDRKSSEEYFNKSIELFKNNHDMIALAASYNNLGRLYNDLSAIDYFYKALDLLEKENHIKGIIDTYYALSNFYWKNANNEEAFYFLEKSIEYIDKLINDSESKRDVFSRYQDIYRLAADVALNIGKEKKAMEITENITKLEKG